MGIALGAGTLGVRGGWVGGTDWGVVRWFWWDVAVAGAAAGGAVAGLVGRACLGWRLGAGWGGPWGLDLAIWNLADWGAGWLGWKWGAGGGLAVAWLGDGDWDRSLWAASVTALGALLNGGGEAGWDVVVAWRPCWGLLLAALGHGVCDWDSAGRAKRDVLGFVDGGVAWLLAGRCVCGRRLTLWAVCNTGCSNDGDHSLWHGGVAGVHCDRCI